MHGSEGGEARAFPTPIFISAPPSDTIKGFGDLVLLFNPAFEALQFSHFYTMIQSKVPEDYNFTCQLPVLAIFTSESDLATKYAFQVGRFFSTIFDTHKRKTDTTLIDEQKADRTAIGHFELFTNYRFESSQSGESTGDSGIISDDKHNFSDFWFGSVGLDQETEFNFLKTATKLSRLIETKRYNPYLLIQVGKNIIEGHNDIWDKDSKILPFLNALINLENDYGAIMIS